MTREEAIERFENVKANALAQKASGVSEYWQNEIDGTIEALDMAIEALSADTVPIEKYHELQHQFVMLGATFADLTEVVRCKDCRHANECHKSVQYTRNEPRTVTIGYSPIEWCSHGERREE